MFFSLDFNIGFEYSIPGAFHECHGFSNQGPLDCLLNSLPSLTNKWNIKVPHHCPFIYDGESTGDQWFNLKMSSYQYKDSCYKNKMAMRPSGLQFNIKMSSYQYRKSRCGDKTVVRSSYLHNGIFYTGKITSLCWIRARIFIIVIPILVNQHLYTVLQCLKLMVTQSPLGTKNWARPVKFPVGKLRL